MDIQVKKLGKRRWEMRLIEPLGEYVHSIDINAIRAAAEESYNHDTRVNLIHRELTESAFTLYHRTAYDRWHWYDESEMNRFITYFTLKHGEK